MSKLRSIQVLRAAAAMMVVADHASGVRIGRPGVWLFFVISGFIIARVAKGRDPLRFMLDRLWRIYPIYWIALLPWLTLAFWLHAETPDRVAASLTLWPVYGDYVQPYLRPAWSLCYEMLFYAAFFVAMVTGKGRWIIAAFFACFLVNLAHPTPLTEFAGSWMVGLFLVGVLLSRFDLSPIERHFSSAAWAPLVFLGDASYSIYLFHMLGTEFLQAPWPVLFAAGVVVGCAMHLTVERPLMDLRRLDRISARERNRAADAGLRV